MGFLDKLLGRRKSEAGEAMKTAPSPASMPAEDTHEHLPGEAMKTAPPPASMPAEDTHEHLPGEDEQAQEHDETRARTAEAPPNPCRADLRPGCLRNVSRGSADPRRGPTVRSKPDRPDPLPLPAAACRFLLEVRRP